MQSAKKEEIEGSTVKEWDGKEEEGRLLSEEDDSDDEEEQSWREISILKVPCTYSLLHSCAKLIIFLERRLLSVN